MIASIRARLAGSLLFRNALWMFAGQGIRLLVQAIYFVVLARTLDVAGYGAFVGVLALTSIAAPFASLGAGALLIKNTARRPELFGKYWGHSLSMTAASGTLLVGVVFLAALGLLPASISRTLILTVTVADLIFAPLLDQASQAYQAHQQLRRTAQIQLLWSALKLGAALTLKFGLAAPSPVAWGALYLASTAVASVLAVRMAWRELGAPTAYLALDRAQLTEGAYFSMSGAARTIYDDIDKTMLTRLATLEATGIYGAAYRVIEIAFMPVRSLLFASYPRFFQHGEKGVRSALGFARKLVAGAAIYGVAAGAILVLAAPLVPYLVGEGYRDSVEAIRWLAILPLLKGLHSFAADTLAGSGHQGWRTTAQLAVAAFNIGINLWLIPRYSWRGAAWASIASDGLLGVSLWLCVWRLSARQGRLEPVIAPAGAPHPS